MNYPSDKFYQKTQHQDLRWESKASGLQKHSMRKEKYIIAIGSQESRGSTMGETGESVPSV